MNKFALSENEVSFLLDVLKRENYFKLGFTFNKSFFFFYYDFLEFVTPSLFVNNKDPFYFCFVLFLTHQTNKLSYILKDYYCLISKTIKSVGGD